MGTRFKSGSDRINTTDAVDLRHMITVAVGTNGNTYPVHESLICASSTFFQTARKPKWSMGKPRVVDLTDERPDTFEVYLHWLYFRTLPTVVTQANSSKTRTGVITDATINKPTEFSGNSFAQYATEVVLLTEEYHSLARCYVLGEKLLDKNFKNAVLDAVVDVMGFPMNRDIIPYPNTIRIVYEGTTTGSPARRLFADIWAHRADILDGTILKFAPSDSVLDLTQALTSIRRKPEDSVTESWKACITKYHEK